MNKLVTRLREPSNSGEGCKHLVLEAADEIERLLESRVPEALPGHRHELVKMGSTIPCARCGGRCIEFTVPNDVWNAVVRRSGEERDDEPGAEEKSRADNGAYSQENAGVHRRAAQGLSLEEQTTRLTSYLPAYVQR